MMTVGSPFYDFIWRPDGLHNHIAEAAGRHVVVKTVLLPSTTTPRPCGGTGSGVAQVWMSTPGTLVIIADIDATVLAFVVFSGFGCGSAGSAGGRRKLNRAIFLVRGLLDAQANTPPCPAYAATPRRRAGHLHAAVAAWE